MNLGEYSGPITAEAARNRFFEIVRQRLNIQGYPVRIGTIDAVYGHPDTGWPTSAKKQKAEGKAGCSAVLCLLIGAILCVGRFVDSEKFPLGASFPTFAKWFGN
jgi:hypothetical protein